MENSWNVPSEALLLNRETELQRARGTELSSMFNGGVDCVAAVLGVHRAQPAGLVT
jgi:hypothetical protein